MDGCVVGDGTHLPLSGPRPLAGPQPSGAVSSLPCGPPVRRHLNGASSVSRQYLAHQFFRRCRSTVPCLEFLLGLLYVLSKAFPATLNETSMENFHEHLLLFQGEFVDSLQYLSEGLRISHDFCPFFEATTLEPNARGEARATGYSPTPATERTLWPVASSAVLGRFRSAALATDTLTRHGTLGAQRQALPLLSTPQKLPRARHRCTWRYLQSFRQKQKACRCR